MHAEDVKCPRVYYDTPLRVASYECHLDAVRAIT